MKSRECKVKGCTNPVWSGGMCKNHIPRISISANRKALPRKRRENKEEVSIMRDFFLSIWNKKPHYSEISKTYLGKEPLSTYFHHILLKSKVPEAAMDEENIILISSEEHERVHSDMYVFDEVNKRRQYLLEKYSKKVL